MNRFSKICLLVIAVSLALRSIVSPHPVGAANHSQYLFERINWQPESIQGELDKRAAEGWELAASYNSGSGASVDLVFRREAR